MSSHWTIEDLKKSKVACINPHLVGNINSVKRSKIKKARNDCPQVVKMHWDLKYWCEANGLILEKEFRFDKKRLFRFDFAIPEKMIGIEYHGLGFKKLGHTTTKGFNSDAEKFNMANTQGWTMLVYTFATYQNVLHDLEKIINAAAHH